MGLGQTHSPQKGVEYDSADNRSPARRAKDSVLWEGTQCVGELLLGGDLHLPTSLRFRDRLLVLKERTGKCKAKLRYQEKYP